MVVCDDRRTAQWAEQVVVSGPEFLPTLRLQPLVVGPHNVPEITEVEQVKRDPELAAYVILLHVGNPRIRGMLKLLAIGTVDEPEDRRTAINEATADALRDRPPLERYWTSLMLTDVKHFSPMAKEVARRITPELEEKLRPKLEAELVPKLEAELMPKLEAELMPKPEAELTPKLEAELTPKLEAKLRAEIEAELRAQAEARAEARSRARSTAAHILFILESRGLTVSEDIRDRVNGCEDPDLMEQWFRRVLTVRSAEDIFGERRPDEEPEAGASVEPTDS